MPSSRSRSTPPPRAGKAARSIAATLRRRGRWRPRQQPVSARPRRAAEAQAEVRECVPGRLNQWSRRRTDDSLNRRTRQLVLRYEAGCDAARDPAAVLRVATRNEDDGRIAATVT